MLIDGEKYACEACVRGHRVSNCQHSDRTLQHIAKKGRPVSQCTHCRTLRKSRSAHVKCDCGEKAYPKGTCIHVREAEPKADTCCCSHGGRCGCALKKELLDPVPESDSDEGPLSTPPIALTRPRAHTVQSEGSALTIFTNGYHKPAHKHNQMAHKCGLPYVVPRAHSIHGASPGGLANRSVDNLPHISTIDALHSESHIKDSMVSAQQEQRMVKSEHNSPVFGSSNIDHLNGQLPPLDLSSLDSYPTDYNFPGEFDGLPAMEQPIFSAGLGSASVDWSHYDGLDFNNDNFATPNFSQPPSFAGFEFSSVEQPALTTTSTSGEISEVEDFAPASSSYVTQKYGSDFDTSDLGDSDGYRLSTASSYMGLPQAQMLASNDVGSLDIDEFLKGIVASSNAQNTLADTQILPATTFDESQKFNAGAFDNTSFVLAQGQDEEGLWMNDFTSNNPVTYTTGTSEGQEQNVWAQ